jgi:hypothetical protein
MPEPRKLTAIKNDEFELVTEPLEAAYTLLMPRGWKNQANVQREHSLNRMIAASISPDENVLIFLGDPRLPLFVPPNPFSPMQMMGFSQPHIHQQPYTPADHFLTDYAHRFFGKAPGFQMKGVGPSDELFRKFVSDLQKKGRSAQVTAAAVDFKHSGQGKELHCRVHGITMNMGNMWVAELFSVSATTDLDRYDTMARRIYFSCTPNQQWLAAQQQLHNHRMAMGQQNLQHINNMTAIQQQGHNQRMQDIHNFGVANTQMHEARMAQMDSSHQSWMNQQAQMDASHQSWMNSQHVDDNMQQARINAIREEHTVADGNGNTYQVDIHHERYYVNKRDNTYIGASAATDRTDLARTHGVNPDDFEEVKIIR